MPYKVGDKFIVEIDRIYSNKDNTATRYGMKGFSCLIFDGYGLDKLEKAEYTKAYRQGLNDAWEAARAYCVDMTYDEVVEHFGEYAAEDNYAFFSIDPGVVIERVKDYRERKKEEETIHFGDEVEAWDTNRWVKFIAVGDEGDGSLVGFDTNGGSYLYPIDSCRKTGKTYQVVGAKMEERNEA